MLKYISICAVLIAVGMGSANAQQYEAVLQKVDIPNSNFDIVVATAKPGGPALDLRGQPDPGVVYLAGGSLVLAYEIAHELFEDAAAMLAPTSVFYAEHEADAPPVALYIVPKRKAYVSAQR